MSAKQEIGELVGQALAAVRRLEEVAAHDAARVEAALHGVTGALASIDEGSAAPLEAPEPQEAAPEPAEEPAGLPDEHAVPAEKETPEKPAPKPKQASRKKS